MSKKSSLAVLVLSVGLLSACFGGIGTAGARASTTTSSTTPAGASPLGQYRVISYEPRNSGNGSTGLSTDLWAAYGSTPVAADLALIRSTGANAVRVFIGTGDTGAGGADPAEAGGQKTHAQDEDG